MSSTISGQKIHSARFNDRLALVGNQFFDWLKLYHFSLLYAEVLI